MLNPPKQNTPTGCGVNGPSPLHCEPTLSGYHSNEPSPSPSPNPQSKAICIRCHNRRSHSPSCRSPWHGTTHVPKLGMCIARITQITRMRAAHNAPALTDALAHTGYRRVHPVLREFAAALCLMRSVRSSATAPARAARARGKCIQPALVWRCGDRGILK